VNESYLSLKSLYERGKEEWRRLESQPWNKELTLEDTLGEQTAGWLRSKPWFSPDLADTVSNVAYSLAVGIGLDTGMAHLEPEGVFTSRAFGTIVNSLTGAVYGRYRDLIYKATQTTPESSKAKKFMADMLSFNTAQTLIYAAAISVASLVESGSVDWEKVRNGVAGLMMLSPFISPTLGWTQNKTREYCGFPTAAEKAATK
jgi:hypothetical protein